MVRCVPSGWLGILARAGICCGFALVWSFPVAAENVETHVARKLTVAVTQSFPPYNFLDSNNTLTGFAIDIMDVVAKRAELDIVYRVDRDLRESLRALRDGEIDIIPSLGITEGRKEFLSFTSPVETFGISIFVRDDNTDIGGPNDLAGRSVAVVAANAARRILGSRTDIRLRVFDQFSDAVFALLSARVDALAYPEPVTWKLAREARVDNRIKRVGAPLREIKRGMAVAKGNTQLLNTLNEALNAFVASAEYQKIYVTWFGQPRPFWTIDRVTMFMGAVLVVVVAGMSWWRYNSVVSLNRALKSSESLLDSIFENVPVGLLIKDRDHVVERPNATYLSWYGGEAEKMIGGRSEEVENFQSDDDAAAMNAQEREVLESGNTLHRQIERPFSDGTVHSLSITKFPIFDDLGNIVKVGSVTVDQTEQVSAHREAHRANTAKTEFLASMSHELRTPLNAILGFAQMLRLDIDKTLSETQKEYVDIVVQGGNHLLELVNEVLDLAKIESKQVRLLVETIDLHDVVSGCVAMVAPLGVPRSIEIIDRFSARSPVLVRADGMRLKQVVLNLVSNAIRFNRDGGSVTIDAAKIDNGRIRVSVSDTGLGIPAREHRNVFRMFHQIGTRPNLSKDGTGVGLYVSKLLMEKMDGKIDFESAEGVGSTFWIELPLAASLPPEE